MLQVRLLGQFDVRADGKRVVIASRAGQSLFAFLILHPGAEHRREKLAGMLWLDATEETARKNLRQELWRIRKAISVAFPDNTGYLTADEYSVTFNAQAAHWLDVAQLERAPAPGESDGERIARVMLYQGELLPGFYDDWVAPERDRIQAVYETQMRELLEHLIAAQQWQTVVTWAEKWIALGQTPEAAYRALMVAYTSLGDRAQAAAAYERCARALQQELGVEPADETRALYDRIKRGEVSASVSLTAPRVMVNAKTPLYDTPPAPGEPPFKGLEFFDEPDANLFFGREQLIEKLAVEIRGQKFLAVVVGASGSGKSSVVRAGLIPALKQTTDDRRQTTENWRVFVMTPTAHPLEALATTLTRDESLTVTAQLIDDLAREPRSLHLFIRRQESVSSSRSSVLSPHYLLVVDQFEELFTLCHDDLEREQFIDNLVNALGQASPKDGLAAIAPASPVHPFTSSPPHSLTLVLTIRADFYAHLAQYPELRDLVAKQQEFIGPMNAQELRRAIEEPAKQNHWEFEPGLVDLILRDVGDEPGALPLLSHALLETWKRRSGHLMTLKGYHDAGGVRGAIALTAESTYQQLTPEQQNIARNIFLRLTELGEGTEDTRRRAEIGELETGDWTRQEVRKVLTLLADARLITTGEHSAEVAHEALIREWPRLREWLNEDREGLKLHRSLTEAAQEWELLERDASMLYRGARLAQAQEFVNTSPNVLNANERAFLDASEENAQSEAREREEQRERELIAAQKLAVEQQARADESNRANKRLRQRAIFLAGSLMLALLLTGIALFLGDAANRNAASAQQNASVAEQNASAANTARLNAEQEKRVARARELAASATSSLDGDPERSILLALEAVKATAQDNVVLPEAQTALHQAVLANRLERTLNGHEQKLFFAKYVPDGSRIVTNSQDGTIRMWDPASGREVGNLSIAPGWISQLNFNGEGTQLGVTDIEDDSSFAKIWDIRTGELVKKFDLEIPADKWWDQAYNRDFSRVAVTSTDGVASIYDVATGERLFTFPIGKDVNCGVTYSPDWSRIAAGCSDGSASVYDAATGKELFKLCCHTKTVNQIVYSPDGTRIATASHDRTGKVWDALTGKELLTLAVPMFEVQDIAFSRDGSRIATNGNDGHPRVWDAKTGIEQVELLGHAGIGRGVSFSPDGTRLVSANEDRTAKIWDITPNKEALVIPTIPLPTDFYFGTLSYSPDGTRIAYGLSDGTIQIWDAANSKLVSTLRGHSAYVNRISFSADGTRLASASDDMTAKVWDLATDKELATFKEHTTRVIGVAFSPDGKRVASGGLYPDHVVRIWDAENGILLNEFKMPRVHIFDVKFSPDGKYLAIGAGTNNSFYNGGAVHILDSTTGEPVIPAVNNEPTYEIKYSPDGKLLAVVDASITPKMFDAMTGQQVVTLRGLNAGTVSMALNRDGARLATIGVDNSVTIWDTSGGEILYTIHDSSLKSPQSIAFSPDGTRLATADLNGIRIYFTQIQDLVALAKSRVTRSLMQEECQKYLHVEECPGN